MTGKRWASDVQTEFLTKYVARYLEAQGNGTLSTAFWPMVFREWFQAFPEKETVFPGCDELTEEQEELLKSKLDARRKMLRTWFRWRGNNTVRKKPGSIILASIPKTRQLQNTEIYSKLYYEDKLKAIVDAEIDGKVLTTNERLAKILEVTKREWEKETEEVKARVFAMKDELRERASKPPSDSSQPSSEDYQNAINNLTNVASSFLDHIKKTTGWIGFMVLGGPKPDIGDSIAISSFFTDDNANGHSFETFHPAFSGEVVKPFGDFLKVVYAPTNSSGNSPPEASSAASGQLPPGEVNSRLASHHTTSPVNDTIPVSQVSEVPMQQLIQPVPEVPSSIQSLPLLTLLAAQQPIHDVQSLSLLPTPTQQSLPLLPAPSDTPIVGRSSPLRRSLEPDFQTQLDQFGIPDSYFSSFESNATFGHPFNFDIFAPPTPVVMNHNAPAAVMHHDASYVNHTSYSGTSIPDFPVNNASLIGIASGIGTPANDPALPGNNPLNLVTTNPNLDLGASSTESHHQLPMQHCTPPHEVTPPVLTESNATRSGRMIVPTTKGRYCKENNAVTTKGRKNRGGGKGGISKPKAAKRQRTA